MVTPRDLISRARAGETGAFADLVRQYRGLVFAVCLQRTGSFDDAEELTQEVPSEAGCTRHGRS